MATRIAGLACLLALLCACSLSAQDAMAPAAGTLDPPDWLQPARTTITAGADMSLVQATLCDVDAYTIVDRNGKRTQQFEYDVERAHSFWIVLGDTSGWGARFRAFVYDADSTRQRFTLNSPDQLTTFITLPDLGTPPLFEAPSRVLRDVGLGADTIRIQSSLHLESMEGEVSYALPFGDLSLQASAGVRYQLIRQDYQANLDNLGNGSITDTQRLMSARKFTGFGPSASLFGQYRLIDSLSVFGGARGAVVLGEQEQDLLFARAITDPLFTAGIGTRSVQQALSRQANEIVPIVEAELGLEYRTQLGWLGVFLRGGLITQTYFGIGGATGGNGDVNLFGVQFTAGIAF